MDHISFTVLSLCWVYFHIRMNENLSAAQQAEKSIRKTCRRRPIIGECGSSVINARLSAASVSPQDHIPVPYQPDSSSNPSSTTSSTPSSPAPPLPSSATPPSPLHPSPQSARQQKQFNLTGTITQCRNIKADLFFLHFCCGTKHLIASMNRKHCTLAQAVRILSPPESPSCCFPPVSHLLPAARHICCLVLAAPRRYGLVVLEVLHRLYICATLRSS